MACSFTLYLKMINISTHIPTCLSEPWISNTANKPTHTQRDECVTVSSLPFTNLRGTNTHLGNVFFSELRDADVLIHT